MLGCVADAVMRAITRIDFASIATTIARRLPSPPILDRDLCRSPFRRPGPISRAMDAPMVPMGSLTVDVVSDVVCPWCYLGKRRLERALDAPAASWHLRALAPVPARPDDPARRPRPPRLSPAEVRHRRGGRGGARSTLPSIGAARGHRLSRSTRSSARRIRSTAHRVIRWAGPRGPRGTDGRASCSEAISARASISATAPRWRRSPARSASTGDIARPPCLARTTAMTVTAEVEEAYRIGVTRRPLLHHRPPLCRRGRRPSRDARRGDPQGGGCTETEATAARSSGGAAS